MRKTNKSVVNPSNPVTAAPTAEDIAAQLMGLMDQIEALVPGFTPHDTNDARRVANVARFAKDLIPQVITTVTALPSVGNVNIFDVEDGKTALELDASMRPVAQRLASLLDGVTFTVGSRLAKSTGQGLAMFAWMKKHARTPEGVAARPYVDEMSRTMKRIMNRRKPVHPPTPVPAGAQSLLAPNLAQAAATAPDDDLPEDFRKALEEAVKD
ncbi:MAG TPA: hypothetical protein VNN25_04920 [Thermoanaerobaculia bacterium]|nr:hypothetical protein [Thermoanaerobaculia bacterium]